MWLTGARLATGYLADMLFTSLLGCLRPSPEPAAPARPPIVAAADSATVWHSATLGHTGLVVGEPLDALLPGDLVVTELMLQPIAGQEAQWIEVLVTGPSLHLDGLRLLDGDGGLHVFTEPVVAARGERVVLGRSRDLDVTGGVAVDAVFGGLTLTPDGGRLSLETALEVVDVVEWDATWPFSPRASLALDRDATSADHNDEAANWCLPTVYGSYDRGTPGAVNEPCGPVVDADDDGYDSGIDCDDTDPTIHPDAPEMPGDGDDDDCDGYIDL